MKSLEAVKLAITEFQKDFLDGEETNEWLSRVIKGLEQAENDLEILEILKKHLKTMPVIGLGTEIYEDITVIPCENEEDADRVNEWLKLETLKRK